MRSARVHPAPPRDEGEGSSETKKMTAAGQDAEAVPPSGASPGAAQGEAAAVSADAKGGPTSSSIESAPAGAAEGQDSAASNEETGDMQLTALYNTIRSLVTQDIEYDEAAAAVSRLQGHQDLKDLFAGVGDMGFVPGT